MKRSLLVFLLYMGWAAIAVAESTSQPLLRARLDKTVVVPGQVLSLEVTILVPTWMPKPPRFPSFELSDASVRLPEGASRPTMERVGGENWSGVTRKYQLSPMVIGHFRIPPQTLMVTYADPETRAPIVVELRTKEFVFEGRAPAGAEDLDPFIAAESLSIEESVEGDPENLEPGFAFTRRVTASLTGASPIFLPPLIPALVAEGLAAYPKEPVFSESHDRGRTTGRRVESVTYVAEAGGRFSAPPVRLRWWNLRTKAIEITETPGFAIVSRGPPPAAPSTLELREFAPWLMVGALLIVLLGATGHRLWPRYAARRRRQHEQKLASEPFAFEEVARALRAQRFGDVIRAMEIWSTRGPMLAQVDRSELFEPLEPLGALLYGRDAKIPSKSQWSTALSALRRERRARLRMHDRQQPDRTLPALNPHPTAPRRG